MKLEQLNSQSTVKDFIKFFKTIPAKDWCVSAIEQRDPKDPSHIQRCARGHCYPKEERLMRCGREDGTANDIDNRLLKVTGSWKIVFINNGDNLSPDQDCAKGIKTRVLRYLKSIA